MANVQILLNEGLASITRLQHHHRSTRKVARRLAVILVETSTVRAQNPRGSMIWADSLSAGTFRVLLGVSRPKIVAEKLLSPAIIPPFLQTGNVIGAHLSWSPNPFRTDLNLCAWTVAKLPLRPHIPNPANA